MTAARPLPEVGSIFLDPRGGERALRVSWHDEAGVVVLSVWRDNLCAASFRLPIEEVPDLIDTLTRALVTTHHGASGSAAPVPTPGETQPLRAQSA